MKYPNPHSVEYPNTIEKIKPTLCTDWQVWLKSRMVYAKHGFAIANLKFLL